MTYEEWLQSVPSQITGNALWDVEVYRKSLFLSDLAWHDCDILIADELGKPIGWQLLRSAGSIPANIEEGYGRGFGKEYARFLRIALGSARETTGWYYRARRLLRPEVVEHRLDLLEAIIAGLIAMSRHQYSR